MRSSISIDAYLIAARCAVASRAICLTHVANYCRYHELPIEISREYFDRAVEVYFTVLSGE